MKKILVAIVAITLLVACSSKSDSKQTDTAPSPKTRFDTSKTVEVADEAFGNWHDSLKQFTKEAQGVRLRIRGQMIRSLYNVEGMQALCRQKINGCSHHIATLGLLCKGQVIADVPESSWVLLTVRVATDSVKIYPDAPAIFMPVLNVDSLRYSVAPAITLLGGEAEGGCGSH